ncbi:MULTISPECIES: hypothetical protein [Bacillus]|nr:hypothetical protein [Bacillus cereus]
MYETLITTPKEIGVIYFIAFVSCFLLYPVAIIIMNIIKGGSDKWR